MSKNDIYSIRYCKTPNCNQLFNITYGEKAFYESKRMHLPTHCERHRGKIRESIPANPIFNISPQKPYKPPKSISYPAKNSGCLIVALTILSFSTLLIAVIGFVIFN